MVDVAADMHLPVSACPACAAAPAACAVAQQAARGGLLLSLPAIHCAICISDVERALSHHRGVRSARVNLTLKRVSVVAEPTVTATELITCLAQIGYEAHELDQTVLSLTQTDKAGRDLLMRIGVSGFAMMNIMLLSVAVWSGADHATRDLFHWISAAIALPTVIFAARPFFASALGALRARRLGMDVPISLAIILATGMSFYETTQAGHHAYFDAAVMLTFFLLVGRYLDFRTRAVARSAAQELAALEVARATRLRDDGAEEDIPVADLCPGDRLRLRPGARVPADAVIETGRSEMDRSVLSGETLPVTVGPGDSLCAGEVNLTGPMQLRVTAAGRDSALHRMADLVAHAESARSKYTSLAERAARAYAPIVHLLALSSFAVWLWFSRDMRLSLNVASAVLIITCPCALGLAVPAVVTSASGRLFRRGMLIKSGTALERLAQVDTVVFDKTGTLTLGEPQPVDLPKLDPRALSVAAALAQGSAHPLARAVASGASALGVVPALLENLHEIAGDGIAATYQGQPVRLGRAQWVGCDSVAATATYLRVGQACHVIRCTDQLREGAAEVVSALINQGIHVLLVSGDAPATVQDLAQKLGIAQWHGAARPEDKARVIANATANGAHVLMVGDGLNDTVALSTAYVSISPASALDAARAASDIVLMGASLMPVVQALHVARSARRRIKQNFAIAAGYNMIAVPVALAGLATPLGAALAMSASSISVSLNALRLKSGR
ncbi:ATPase [Thioclava sp. SK-1]|uniref:heavy metal translocating P-type ATPase n=1 Tax=Thioclava sp. SK-1 TaxID=1889770 RepID=UPI00082525D7|nr:heavy metal translocating P-type ATPase [Thioclava sp. SK-1]OCX66662.1 ATPase [Thioclava sp. SK-1]